jgi:hypothetical protein
LKHCDSGARVRGEGRGMMSKLAGAAVAVSVVAVSGCAGPTYGTGKPAEQQLMEDVTGILSIGPKDRQAIDYSPRPGIVKPPSTEVLPPPQESVAASGNPAWPESPEQRLARIRAEATANQDNPSYRANVIRDVSGTSSPSLDSGPTFTNNGMIKPDILQPASQRREQRQAYLARRQQTQQGSPTTRRYLSDPPIDYRQPSPNAPADDLGVEEAKKERQAKAGSGTGGLRKLLPWLN